MKYTYETTFSIRASSAQLELESRITRRDENGNVSDSSAPHFYLPGNRDEARLYVMALKTLVAHAEAHYFG